VFNARDARKYQPADFTDPENVELLSKQSGTDHAFAVNAGVLWNVSSDWVVGGSFRQGPKFEFSTDTRRGAASGIPGDIVRQTSDNPFRVPDTYSIGVLYRPSELWRLSVEYDRVQYHQLIDDLRDTAFYENNQESLVVLGRIRVNDSNQIRVGGEYLALLSGNRSLAFRAGLWHDPNHQAYFDGDPATGLPAPRWSLLFPRRDGNVYISGGIGFTTRRHFQLDGAVESSGQSHTFSISSVWRF
jgi:long-subunit fatty acid transport protein